MATRFSFTEEQFNEIKRLLEKGKKSRYIGEKFDLSDTTLRRIQRAKDFDEYKLNQRMANYTRQRRKANNAARVNPWLAVMAIIELLVIIMLVASI